MKLTKYQINQIREEKVKRDKACQRIGAAWYEFEMLRTDCTIEIQASLKKEEHMVERMVREMGVKGDYDVDVYDGTITEF